MKKIKFKHLFWIFGLFFAMTLLFGVEASLDFLKVPFGAELVMKMAALPSMVFGVAVLYFGTRALYDYFDGEKFSEKAMETSQGAGLAMIAVAVTRLAIALMTMGMFAIFIK